MAEKDTRARPALPDDAIAGATGHIAAHNMLIDAVEDLRTIQDGKAALVHSHTIANVTELQTALDGKSPTSHTHSQYLDSAKILAGTNITLDKTTTPGSVIISSTGGGGGSGLPEVHIGPEQMTGSEVLWVDTDEAGPSYATKQYVDSGLAGKAPLSHTHALGDLPSTLATDAEVASAVAAHEAKADPHPQYVNLSGDTMTGPLVLPGNAASNLQAVPKQQLDSAVAARIPIAGAKTAVTTPIDFKGDLVIGLSAAHDAVLWSYNQFVLRRTDGSMTTVAHAPAQYGNQSMLFEQNLVYFDPAATMSYMRGAEDARAAGLTVVEDGEGNPIGVPVPEVVAHLLGSVQTLAKRVAELDGQWAPWVEYATAQQTLYDGVRYACLQGHTSQPGWEPPHVPALWQPVEA